jgi:CHRD domain
MKGMKSILCFATLFLASVTLAACGGDDDSPTPPASSTVITKIAALDNAQETPPTNSTAKGGGVLTVDTVTGQVRGFVVSTGLDNVTAAHVHTAARGIAGGITIPLVGGPDHWFVPDNAAVLNATQIADFVAGDMYYNIHNLAFSGGAIRGQLDVP